jgi:stress-induced-phosphoprotein 1
LSKGDAKNALGDGVKCIELNPQFAKGYSRKGAALHSLKRYDDAAAAYEAGLLVAPNDAGLQNGLAEVMKAKNAPPQSGGFNFLTPQLLSKLAAHPKFGPKLADPVFMNKLRMIQTNPQLMLQDPEIMEIFGVMMGDEGAGEGEDYAPPPASSSQSKPSTSTPAAPKEESYTGLSEEEIRVRKNKKLALAAKENGNNLYKSKNFPAALAAYDEACELDPSNVSFLSNKCAVYIEMGEYDRAISECERAVEYGRSQRAPYEDIAKLYQREASAWLKKDDMKTAINRYQKAQMENFDKAIERKIKNLELDLRNKERQDYINPELGLEAKEKGNAAFRNGDFPKAISEYEEAIKRDPTNAAYRNNLAATLLKIGDFNGAKANVEKSLELDKKYVKAWAKKGDIEFYMKEYHKALDSYKMGLQLEPDNALCTQGLNKTIQQVNSSQGHDSERAAHAMADPEIQSILSDPMVRQVLSDAQKNPASIQRAMADHSMRAKIEKLIAAGVLQTR